jgi:hypothetical protein
MSMACSIQYSAKLKSLFDAVPAPARKFIRLFAAPAPQHWKILIVLLKGQCHEMVVEVRPWSGSLALN